MMWFTRSQNILESVRKFIKSVSSKLLKKVLDVTCVYSLHCRSLSCHPITKANEVIWRENVSNPINMNYGILFAKIVELIVWIFNKYSILKSFFDSKSKCYKFMRISDHPSFWRWVKCYALAFISSKIEDLICLLRKKMSYWFHIVESNRSSFWKTWSSCWSRGIVRLYGVFDFSSSKRNQECQL